MKVTIDIPERMLREMVEKADLKIVNLKAFRKAMKTKKFQKEIAADMLNVWGLENDDAEGDYQEVVLGIFGDLVVDPNEEEED